MVFDAGFFYLGVGVQLVIAFFRIMVARMDCGAGQFSGQRGQIARNRVAQDQAGASMGGCPGWWFYVFWIRCRLAVARFVRPIGRLRPEIHFFSSHLRSGMQAKMEPQNIKF